jgi:hypothetical protein
MLNDRGFRARFPAGMGIFLFTTASRTPLRPTQPPIQWIPVPLSQVIKRPGREADHSTLSSAKDMWSYTSTPNKPLWPGTQLKKHRDFIFAFYYLLSRATFGLTEPSIQWVRGGEVFSPGVKRPGREANHSPPSSAEDVWIYTSTPCLHGVVLN